MFFRKKDKFETKPQRSDLMMRWMVTDVYDQTGNKGKKVGSKRVLQYCTDNNWQDVYEYWTGPIFLKEAEA